MSSPSTKPDEETLFSIQSLPDKLQEQPQWVCWMSEGTEEMVGINPLSGDRINTLGEGSSLDEAKRELNTSDYDGVAFAVLQDGKFVAIRLPNAVKEMSDGVEFRDGVGEVIESVDSYTEVGPYSDDVLILVEGSLPEMEFESEEIQFTTEGIIPLSGRALDNYGSIAQRQKELEAVFEEHNEWELSEDSEEDEETVEIDEDVTLSDVRETVVKNFDDGQWHLTEAILSTHATLFIGGIQNCAGLIAVGQSGAGKTTALRFFEGLGNQFYRSDEVTPASFVTHDASLSEEQLGEVDLLPRIKHKSLLCRDMETWFSGDRENIRTTMSRMTHLMDGEGLTRDSGSHGKRGYEGDFRFSFIGASTPLKSRAWDVMGNAGYRFVFYHLEGEETDRDTLEKDLFETNYRGDVDECNRKVLSLLSRLWDKHGGYGSVPDEEIEVTGDARSAIAYLADVVRFSRATVIEDSEKEPTANREKPHRVGAVLRDIAKGRALLDERTNVTVDDVDVSARIALSTMPQKRRPIVRALLDSSNQGQLTRKEAQDALGVSKPTALDRMELMDTLDIAEFTEVEGDGRESKKLELKDEFEWPDSLPFPSR